MTTQLPDRIQGATLPDTEIFWKEDGVYLDLSGYTGWQVEARSIGGGTVLWTKTSGITVAAGSATVPNVTIPWTNLDMGALAVGTYDLELTGTFGGKLRKHKLRQKIEPEVA